MSEQKKPRDRVIINYKDGSFKKVERNHAWEYENDSDYLSTEEITDHREYWICGGISQPCQYHAAVYTKTDLDLAENKDFILSGIHVIEYSALESAQKRIAELEAENIYLNAKVKTLEEVQECYQSKYDSLKARADKIVDKLKSGALLEVTGPTYREVKALIMEYDQSQVSKLINEE